MTLRRNHAGVSKAASYTVRRKAEPRELCSWPKRPPLAAQSQNSPSSRRRQKQYQSAAGSVEGTRSQYQRPPVSAIL